jgi:5'-nucleotidase
MATRTRVLLRYCMVSLASILAAACGSDGHHDQPPFTVKIIAINDYHGNLQSPGTFGANLNVPAAQRPAVGGAEYLAAYVAKAKAANPLNVVVAAGDNIGASPLISALFLDEPAVETLNRIGLEFSSVGNHEFDKGSTELLRLQSGGCKVTNGVQDPGSCRGAQAGTPVPFEGAKFQWLSANVVKTSTGQTLLPAYGVKTFNGVKVAFIGMTLKDTPTIVTPTGVAGLQFNDEAATVNALVPQLRAQGIEAIVVLVHQGGFQTGALSDINGCDGGLAGSDIANIVAKLDDAVDLVVSGHTHAAYNCTLPNSKGRMIPVTSTPAFARTVTEIDATIDPQTSDITSVVANNKLVSRSDPAVTADAAVAAVVNGYNGLVAPIANQVIGSITADLPASSSDAACNVAAGDLIADGMLEATKAAAFGGASIAFMNRGGVRGSGYLFKQSVGEGDGNVTYGEAFTVQPFGNSLVTLTLSAQALRTVLEEQFAGCHGQTATTTRVMLTSAGFKYTWDGSQACDARIRQATLTANGTTETIVSNGVVVNPAKTYRVTVNNFMATGGDGFSTFLTQGKEALGGAQDIDATVAYITASYKAPKSPYAPGSRPEDAGTPRINRIGGTSCPGGANTNP